MHRERYPPRASPEPSAVFKAYTTRVGYGPFPTELTDVLGDQLREVGAEYGTTTGRARRVGWFDAAVSRYAVATKRHRPRMVLTKVDVLDEFETLKICTGYLSKGESGTIRLANISHLKHVEPIYEEFPGWTVADPGMPGATRSSGRLPHLHRADR